MPNEKFIRENRNRINWMDSIPDPQTAMLCGRVIQRAKEELAALKREQPGAPLQDADWVSLSICILIANRQRELKFLSWLMSDRTDFLQDLASIYKGLHRATEDEEKKGLYSYLPDDVYLRFATRNPGQGNLH